MKQWQRQRERHRACANSSGRAFHILVRFSAVLCKTNGLIQGFVENVHAWSWIFFSNVFLSISAFHFMGIISIKFPTFMSFVDIIENLSYWAKKK